MTHLSDYSYIERGVGVLFYLIWTIYHIRRVGGFKAITLEAVIRREPKATVTVLLLASMVLSIVYDCLGSFIKYTTGFYNDPVRGCITTPKSKYPQFMMPVLIATDFFLNVSWSSKSCALFLVQLTWHHVSKQYTAHHEFLSSREISVFKILSVVSLVLYPLLQFIFLYDALLSTITPQFVSHFENVCLAALCIYTARRFDALRQKLPPGTRNVQVLEHYSHHNRKLALCLLGDGLFLFFINIDNLTLRLITPNKFWLDLFTRVFNIGFVMTYPTSIDLLYPGVMGGGESHSQHTRKSYVTADKKIPVPGTGEGATPMIERRNPFAGGDQPASNI